MGISAKPIGKMASVMKKIQNKKDAEAKIVKRLTGKKKSDTEPIVVDDTLPA